MAKKLLDLVGLEAFLSGEDAPVEEPTPKPQSAQPMPGLVEFDRPVGFVDLLRGQGVRGKQRFDVKQKPPENTFAGFLLRHSREKTARLKRLIGE